MRLPLRLVRAALVAVAMVLALCSPSPASAAGAHAAKHPPGRRAALQPALRGGAPEPEAFGVPFLDPRDGAVHWPLRAEIPLSADDRRLLDELGTSRGPRDSIEAWLGAAERDPLLAPRARIEAARIALFARDSAAAETLLAVAAGVASPWRWTALHQRALLALEHDGAAAADTLLRLAPLDEMSPADELECAEDRIEVLVRLGESAQAIALARRAMAAPLVLGPAEGARSAPWIAVRIENRLEGILSARGERPGWEDEMAAAAADLALGDRAAALGRLGRAALVAPPEARWRAALQRAGVLRASRRYDEAREALGNAGALAPDSAARAQVELARIGVAMDARDWPEVERVAAELESWPDARVRKDARVLHARALESQGAWARAADAYAADWWSRPDSADRSAFRAGLLTLALGQPDSAVRWFSRSRSEGSRFWRGMLLRRARDPAGDSLLGEVAREPGFSFYEVAARETLGLRGWPDAGIAAPAANSSGLRFAGLLVALGRSGDARLAVPRWLAWRVRSGGAQEGSYPLAGQVLHAAALAYSSKSAAYAIVLSDLAFGVTSDSAAAVRWPYVPWSYPPPYESAFAALPESTSGGIDRPLMRSLARKESHFHAGARSGSDALGLLQLKLGTAREAARAGRLRRPRERDLLDPVRNVRLGVAYLARLLGRFGSVPRALAAYNAGPGALARWLALWETAPGRAIGGVALECELTCRDETIRYVKEVLAARAAYRELRPIAGP